MSICCTHINILIYIIVIFIVGDRFFNSKCWHSLNFLIIGVSRCFQPHIKAPSVAYYEDFVLLQCVFRLSHDLDLLASCWFPPLCCFWKLWITIEQCINEPLDSYESFKSKQKLVIIPGESFETTYGTSQFSNTRSQVRVSSARYIQLVFVPKKLHITPIRSYL